MNQQEQNTQVVEAYVRAFNAGDMEKLAVLFSPRAEIQGVLGKGLMEKAMSVWVQLVQGLGMQLRLRKCVLKGKL